jgi:hypothetical protein
LERDAILNARVRAFILRGDKLSKTLIIELLKFSMPKMLKAIARYKPPFIFGLDNGELTALSNLEELCE